MDRTAATARVFNAAFTGAFMRGTEADASSMRPDTLLSAVLSAATEAGGAAYDNLGINLGCMNAVIRDAANKAFQAAGDHRRALEVVAPVVVVAEQPAPVAVVAPVVAPALKSCGSCNVPAVDDGFRVKKWGGKVFLCGRCRPVRGGK